MSTSHEQRTAAEPRDNEIHDVVISDIVDVTANVRLLKLRPLEASRSGIMPPFVGFHIARVHFHHDISHPASTIE